MLTRCILHNDIGRLAYRRGMTDRDVAQAAGLSRAHVNRIKNGSVTPRVDTALAIARALDAPVRRVFRLPPTSNAG